MPASVHEDQDQDQSMVDVEQTQQQNGETVIEHGDNRITIVCFLRFDKKESFWRLMEIMNFNSYPAPLKQRLHSNSKKKVTPLGTRFDM